MAVSIPGEGTALAQSLSGGWVISYCLTGLGSYQVLSDNGGGSTCPAEKGLRAQRGHCSGHTDGELWTEEGLFLLGQANDSKLLTALLTILTAALRSTEQSDVTSPNCFAVIIPSIYTKHLSSQESAVFSQHWFSKPARLNWIKIHSSHSQQAYHFSLPVRSWCTTVMLTGKEGVKNPLFLQTCPTWVTSTSSLV